MIRRAAATSRGSAAATGGSRTEWLRSLALWAAIAAGAVLGALAYSAIGMRG